MRVLTKALGAVRAGVLAASLVAPAAPWAAGAAGPAAASRGAAADRRIDAFWAWWRSSAAPLAAALDAKKVGALAEPLSARVRAIHPRLAWETGPGVRGARHQLVVTAEGDPELRVLAERWLARAPRADAAWEYHAARQPIPRATLGGFRLDAERAKIDFAEARLRWIEDPARELLDVTFHHPALGALSDEEQRRVALLILGNVLGEDGLDRWVGRIEISVWPLSDGKPLAALADGADALAKRATGDRWSLLRGETADGQPSVAAVNAAVKRIDHLAMDHHLEVTMPYAADANGLPPRRESAALDAAEDELVAALGRDAVYLGHETGGGRRSAHFHVAGQGPAEARARAWARGHAGRRIEVAVRPDPAWEVLDRWR